MDSILEYERKPEEDFYNILGVDELSDVEQINCEYKLRARECHPDKHPDNPRAAEQFALLQEAKETLCDPEKRAQYDTWGRSGIAVPYPEWCARKDAIQTEEEAAAATTHVITGNQTLLATSSKSSVTTKYDVIIERTT